MLYIGIIRDFILKIISPLCTSNGCNQSNRQLCIGTGGQQQQHKCKNGNPANNVNMENTLCVHCSTLVQQLQYKKKHFFLNFKL